MRMRRVWLFQGMADVLKGVTRAPDTCGAIHKPARRWQYLWSDICQVKEWYHSVRTCHVPTTSDLRLGKRGGQH